MAYSPSNFAELLEALCDARVSCESSLWEPEFQVHDEWHLPTRQADFWRSCAQGEDELHYALERAMARAMLSKLLIQNRYLQTAADGSGSVLAAWPSRDRHQLWATLWLALYFRPERRYSAEEVNDFLTIRFRDRPEPPLQFAVLADIERRELILRDADDGFVLSRARLDFVLQGDKLFEVRAAVASRRPWWMLPIGRQYIASPRPSEDARPCGTQFRCILLDTQSIDAHLCVNAQFVPLKAGDVYSATNRGEIQEGDHCFFAITCAFQERVTVSEVCVSAVARSCERGDAAEVATGTSATGAPAVARLPPFRVEVIVASPDGDENEGVWQLLQCQPMPTADEMCNAGRDAVRCFLPNAVVVHDYVPPPSGVSMLFEGGPPWLVKRWPSKQKQQGEVVGWLAAHLLPDVFYDEAEIDWLIVTRHALVSVPDCPAIRKEFERRGLVERQPGAGGFRRRATKMVVSP